MFRSFLLMVLAVVALAFSQGPKVPWNTEAEFRAFEPEILEMIGRFYTNPLAPGVDQDAKTIYQWAIRAPHIGFRADQKYVSELGKGDAYHHLFASACLYGEIELKLKEKKEYSPEEVDRASLSGLLKAYRAMLASKPDVRREVLDRYLEMEKSGTLLRHFEGRPSKSVGSPKELPSHYGKFEYGIKVKDPAGGKVKLKEWKNRDVLFLYVSAGCSHCRTFTRTIMDSVKTKADIIMLFSRINTPEQIQEFLAEVPAKYKYFLDYGARFGKQYGGGMVPVTMLVRKDGSATRVGGTEPKEVAKLFRDLNAL